MLAALGALMLGGIILSLAASPSVAVRIGLDPFHFVNRHVMYLAPTFLVLIATSFLSPRHIRRGPVVVLPVSIVLTPATPGCGVRGVRRRDQRRSAMDRARRHQHPAVRVPQAGLRHPYRMAVRRVGAATGNAGKHGGAVALVPGGRFAGDAAGLRADHAGRAG